jgi:hypothetical protein
MIDSIDGLSLYVNYSLDPRRYYDSLVVLAEEFSAFPHENGARPERPLSYAAKRQSLARVLGDEHMEEGTDDQSVLDIPHTVDPNDNAGGCESFVGGQFSAWRRGSRNESGVII